MVKLATNLYQQPGCLVDERASLLKQIVAQNVAIALYVLHLFKINF
jgi:hypothetical protein